MMDGTGVGVFLYLVACAAFGGLGAFVAGAKGRSVGEGFLLGSLFGPIGALIEALLPTVRGAAKATGGGPARVPAPGLVRPRRSLRPDDLEITRPEDPPGWRHYRRLTTGEDFWSPAPERTPPPAPEPRAPTVEIKRWDRPLRRIDRGPGG